MEESDRPIGLYDLRYALHYDENDPAQICMVWDHCHAVSALQGIVNRSGPSLYILFQTYRRSGAGSTECEGMPDGDGNIDLYWFEKYRQPGEWLSGRPVVEYSSIVELVEAYRSFIRGAVIYDPEVPATSNVASTIAGVEDLIPVRYDTSPGSLYAMLVQEGPRLPVRAWLLEPDGRSKFTGRGEIPEIGRPSTGSAKCDAYLWMKHKYMDSGLCDACFAAYSLDFGAPKDPGSYLGRYYPFDGGREKANFDFFVSRKGFFFDLSPWEDEPATDDPAQAPGTDFRTLCELLLSAYEHGGKENMIHVAGFPPFSWKYSKHIRHSGPEAVKGKHGGVDSEWEFIRVISAYNGFLDTDNDYRNAMTNASFWTHFPLEEEYPQKWVTREELRERGYLTEEGEVNFDGRKFVMIYVGDYDGAGGLYLFMPFLWYDPDRGSVPIAWSISPVLAERAPMVMHHMWKTATPMDFFTCANNGAGYLNTSMLAEPRPISALPSGLDAWAKHCSKHYRRWGLTVTGFVIDGYAPPLNEEGLDCYASFSPNGICPFKGPLSLLHKGMPVLLAGTIMFDNELEKAVPALLEDVKEWPVPFYWARTIFNTPEWYRRLHEAVEAADPKVELLDAPTFFELYRIWLESSPDAASGKVEIPPDEKCNRLGTRMTRDFNPGDPTE